MRVHPQKVVARLTPTAKRYLEQAVGKAVEAQHPEITPEHVLLAMSAEPGGDTEVLLRALDRDPRKLRSELEQSLRTFRAGSASKPRISDSLVRWLEDAWVLASLEWGETALRSGALLAQIVLGGGRYLSETVVTLSSISADALRACAADALSITPESTEAVPARTTERATGDARVEGAPGPGSALSRFTNSFTDAARAGRIDPVFGREREIRQVIDVLCRRRKNNPILVGEPGVGKTALVEGLARAIVAGDVPESLRGVDLRGLDLGSLEAGASVKGEFEARLKSVIQEVQTSTTPIVLFIDEAHTLIGAGNQKGGADAANLLKPALARGELRTIAATTWAEYKQYFEKDAALERRFQPIKVEEPSEDVAIGMLRGLRTIYEDAHDVIIRDEAVEAAVRLGHRYITGRQLPDKSVDLLDTTAARVRVERSARPEKIVALDADIASTTRRKEAIARDLVDHHDAQRATELIQLQRRISELDGARSELMVRWAAQREALERALGARRAMHEAARKMEEGDGALDALEADAKQALDALRALCATEPLVAIDVDAAAVARTVELWTGVPVGAMQSATSQAVLSLGERLRGRVLGQDAALDRVAESLRVAQAGLRNPDAPMGVFLLVGPSGVGKTETAYAIADLLFGGSRFLTTINLSEYQEPHTATRLIGSPPSYVGYGEGGELSEAVRQRPYSVVLLDECEKAALEVMNTFYQVFDKGVLSDAEGRQIDFRNTCILLTSNLASDRVVELCSQGKSIEEVTEAIRPALARHFKPALLNRMTVVPYAPIGESTMGRIVDIELGRVATRVRAAHDVHVSFADAVRDRVVARCTEIEGGVRYVRQMLERAVLVPLATELLVARGDGKGFTNVDVAIAESGDVSIATR
ncbi:type VI secretion system ATPase TssH [Sandaracinus amylolyticus]|uniref:type VI secretion system ATPase TssH n=1 Tax=Sandaracinus amylolyticus TaxID=927083 RepID=UPI001F3AAC78|nr:type VI secretion system ATPase TssH [Sandaracinus amylolyticus]UJR78610.1 Type VI secretion system protein VasG [Sandaracinus amylolyticus]